MMECPILYLIQYIYLKPHILNISNTHRYKTFINRYIYSKNNSFSSFDIIQYALSKINLVGYLILYLYFYIYRKDNYEIYYTKSRFLTYITSIKTYF